MRENKDFRTELLGRIKRKRQGHPKRLPRRENGGLSLILAQRLSARFWLQVRKKKEQSYLFAQNGI
jgi:hypothetical protein